MRERIYAVLLISCITIFAITVVPINSAFPFVGGEIADSNKISQSEYLQVGNLQYTVLKNQDARMTVNVTNIDDETHRFSLMAMTSNSLLTFHVGADDLPRNLTGGLYYHDFPMEYTLVPYEIASISLFFTPRLPWGVVYTLTSFSVILEIDSVPSEIESVDFLVSEPYEAISNSNLTDHGFLSDDITYSLQRNPMDIHTNSTLSVTVLNNDTLPHNYTLRLTDRAGRIRSFKGDDEYQIQMGPTGPYIEVPLGVILPYNTRVVPIKLLGLLIPGSRWSRYIVEISVFIDVETTLTKKFGLDVGIGLPTFLSFSGLALTFEGNVCTVQLSTEGDVSQGLFGLVFPFSDFLVVLERIAPGLLGAVITKAILPALFDIPVTGLQAAIIGFLVNFALGLIIRGTIMLSEGNQAGTILIIYGIMILITVICVICTFLGRRR